MAKILSTTKVNGNVVKFFETADNFVINSQVYDKNTFSAKALDFLPIYGSTRGEMILYTNVLIDTIWANNRTENSFIVDSNDSNIMYVCTPSIYGSSGIVYKITKTSVGYTIATAVQPAGAGDSYQFISQDNTKVYGVLQRDYSSAYCYFFSIDKATFAINWSNNGYANAVRILKETDSYFYFSCCWANHMYTSKFNKNTSAITTLLDDPNLTAVDFRCLSSPMTDSGDLYVVRDAFVSGGTHRAMYRKYNLDYTRDFVSYVDMVTDLSLKPNAAIPFNAGSSAVKHELFFVRDGSKTYLNHVVYNNGTVSVALTADKCGLYTYEITGANTMKLVSFKEFNPIVYKGMMTMYENKLLILGSETGVHFYNWNSATTAFEKTTGMDAPTMAFGADMNNNIFIQYADSSIEMLSNMLPISIYADFQYDVYTYNGTEIDATLEVYSRNFMNQYLNSSVELTLFGPVRFADTGLKKKTITTSNLNKTSLPVIVSGEGILKVNTKLI